MQGNKFTSTASNYLAWLDYLIIFFMASYLWAAIILLRPDNLSPALIFAWEAAKRNWEKERGKGYGKEKAVTK